jgi:hypothetical protein
MRVPIPSISRHNSTGRPIPECHLLAKYPSHGSELIGISVSGHFLWFINELQQARKRVESPFSTTFRHPASTCSQALKLRAVLPDAPVEYQKCRSALCLASQAYFTAAALRSTPPLFPGCRATCAAGAGLRHGKPDQPGLGCWRPPGHRPAGSALRWPGPSQATR